MRTRTDKDAPNYVTVYKHTLQSILDDITAEEIVAFVSGVLEKQKKATAEAGMGYA
jgi:mRNA-capping enzyme